MRIKKLMIKIVAVLIVLTSYPEKWGVSSIIVTLSVKVSYFIAILQGVIVSVKRILGNLLK
jgi:hypothetical protein